MARRTVRIGALAVAGAITVVSAAMVLLGIYGIVFGIVADGSERDSSPTGFGAVLILLFSIPAFFGYQLTRLLLSLRSAPTDRHESDDARAPEGRRESEE